jgi:hypothetical protein
LDAVFVSIDLEHGWMGERFTKTPLIKEADIAKLDTRDLITAISKYSATKVI